MSEALRVLGIFPHPDDESYSCGGTLARLAASGARVEIVCATAGGAGQDLRGRTDTSPIDITRSRELACSCASIGARQPRFLGLPDGAIETVDFPDAAGRIVHEIRSMRPHIVISLGTDGVYGHPDHIALYRLIVAAFAASAGGERFPADRFGEEWAPERLFLAAFPRGMFRPMYDHMLLSEYAGAMRALDPDSLGVEPPDVAAAVDIRAFADRKLASIACHRSQLHNGDPYTLFPGDLVRRTLTTELFTVGAGSPVSGRLRSLDEDLSI